MSLAYAPFTPNDSTTIGLGDHIEQKKQERDQQRNRTVKRRPTNDNSNVQKVMNVVRAYDDIEDNELADFNPPPKPELSKVKEGSLPAPTASDRPPMLPDTAESPAAQLAREQRMEQQQATAPPWAEPAAARRVSPADRANEAAGLPRNLGMMDNGAANMPTPYRYPPSQEGFANANGEEVKPDAFMPYFTRMSDAQNGRGPQMMNRDQILDKLNYLIHLLEEQQDQKTGSAMEDVILYTFLGVFMIFMVDGFARAGKYTR
jgi:hypothetical protein